MKRTQIKFIPNVLLAIRDNNKYPSMLIYAKHHRVLLINRDQIGFVVPERGGARAPEKFRNQKFTPLPGGKRNPAGADRRRVATKVR